MNWLDIGKEIIKYGAPLLGFAVGGPAGASIASEVANLFGANANNPEDVLNKMQSDPDAKIKLAQIESSKSIELQNIAFEKLKAQMDHEDHESDNEEKDVEDARKMEESNKSYMPHVITIVSMLSFVVSLTLLFTLNIPVENKKIIIGMLFILAYQYLNSSRFWVGGIVPSIQDIKDLLGKK